jgi:NAD(P)-dependent dehydrogenase (short-subunit alcohol dehydrogenase family)
MQAIMNTNFFGAVRCLKAVVPAMRARGSGLIMNISSIASRMAPFAQGAYAASKFALEAASEALAQELAPFRVGVALVKPGVIASDMAVGKLPSPHAGSAYPHARRMLGFYADAGVSGTAPTVVADTVLDIVSGRITAFRTLAGKDSAPFLALRNSMTDEAWIALSDTLDDGVLLQSFGAAGPGGLISERPHPTGSTDYAAAASRRLSARMIRARAMVSGTNAASTVAYCASS